MSSVTHSKEFERIAALPRRQPRDWEQIALELTALLKTPEGTMTLRPIQAQALVEMGEQRGLFGSIVVGGGKTLISLLSPYVFDADRAILFLPAALVQKTVNESRVLAKHWRIRMPRLISYDEMGREAAEQLLQGQRPDLIIGDEIHRLKNWKAGVTRRVARYMRQNPETPMVVMSGTVMKKTLQDFAHIVQWTHKDAAPVPLNDGELEEWANALDEGINPLRRTDPGPLVDWCPEHTPTPEEPYLDELTRARRGFHDRFTSTPGVVATSTENVACSLYINILEYETNAATEANFATLRRDWATPDEWDIGEAAVAWMYARELAIGLHYVWDPRPIQAWRDARKAWNGYVRAALSKSRTLDTEKTVVTALEDGRLDDADGREVLATWRKIQIESGFVINPDFHWHDDAALDVCVKWAKKGPGIIWVEHTFFGKELSKRTGLPYFGAKGLDVNGRNLSDLVESINDKREKPGVILASVAACGTGFNLQPWRRNLITAVPAGAATWEQLLGRTHRPGQMADDIEVDVMIGCREHWEGWERAVAGAQAIQDTLGQPQKLILADRNFRFDIRIKSGQRWSKQSSCEE